MTESENDDLPRPFTKHQLNALISLVVQIVLACGILMWSVFNFWLNVLAYRANDDPDQAWFITAILVLITCVVPFGLGVWLLVKSLGKPNKR